MKYYVNDQVLQMEPTFDHQNINYPGVSFEITKGFLYFRKFTSSSTFFSPLFLLEEVMEVIWGKIKIPLGHLAVSNWMLNNCYNYRVWSLQSLPVIIRPRGSSRGIAKIKWPRDQISFCSFLNFEKIATKTKSLNSP